MQVKADEENYEEAEAQAYRAWTPTTVPSEVASLLADSGLASVTPTSSPFERLLAGLAAFVRAAPHGTLPLTATLPDMKADTARYVALQTLYKREAEADKARFRALVPGDIDDALVDAFVKNAHALRILRGRPLGAFDGDAEAVG
jgi:amyloid beta precursor protein binding protein 1